MTSASVESSLSALNVLFGLIAVIRLIQLRLARSYPLFLLFLCIPIPINLAACVFGSSSKMFYQAFLVLEPIRNISYILVAWELFSSVFRNYAGLRSLSRWVMGIAAAIAPLGLILTFLAPGSKVFKRNVLAIVRFERGVTFGLVIFIVILLYFISKYPIKLPRNIVVLCMLYSIWFLADSTVLVGSSYVPAGYVDFVNYGLAVFEFGSYLGWAILLSKAGEYQETRVRQSISPERERSLIGELETMNQLLLRAGRSISHNRPAGD
jgi:hypothetical protein